MNQKKPFIKEYFLKDDGIFPNSHLPVVFYKGVLKLPLLFPANYIIKLFRKNNWKNSWKSGIFEYQHYHSITHEVMGVYKGKTTLLIGGDEGIQITIEKGDVLILPAGVAHKNLKKEKDVKCVGAYPNGKRYDMNFGVEAERPKTDKNIKEVKLPGKDPVFGKESGIVTIWA